MTGRMIMEEIMLQLEEINQNYCRWIREDRKAHEDSAAEELAYMAQSTARYHGRCVSTLYIPKIFREEDIKRFHELLEILYGIFHKVIRQYREDVSYRRLFAFDPRLEKMILSEPSYSCEIPMARIDIFYQEDTGDFSFCEFNTDGTSAMNEDRELNIGLARTKGYEKLSEEFDISTFELFDSWVDTSLSIFHEARPDIEKPVVAIVDFMESATNNEFEIFAEHYRARGLTCEICEIRQMQYRDGRLYTPSGIPVDMVYRRAVTSDIMKHYEEVTDFIRAAEEHAVCLLGEFSTQIVHDKVLYEVLHHPMTQEFLSEEEQEYIRRHVPFTAGMCEEHLPYEEICEQKDQWILKPRDSYGSKGVFAGVEYESEEEWKEIVRTHRQKDYLAQRFQTPYHTDNIALAREKDAGFIQVANLTGLFVYGEKFAGIYSRISRGEIISTQYSEMALPTVVVHEKK